MFKSVDGKVEKVEPVFGKKFYNRDGSVGTYYDGAVEVPPPSEPQHFPVSGAVISPKGYM